MGDSDGTTLGPYLSRVGEVALLTAEQEVDLAKRAQAGLAAAALLTTGTVPPARRPVLRRVVLDGAAASEHVLRANLRLVISMARRYQGRGLEFPDLVQEGNLGLMKAVERFDHARGFRFSTYASWWIRQAITRGLADRGRAMRLPIHAHEILMKLRWVELERWQQLGREPTEAELADQLEITLPRLREIRAAAHELASLDAPAGGEGDTSLSALLADANADDPELVVSTAEVRESVLAALAKLDERERRVLEMRFGITDGRSRTLDDIGAEFGVTRERIRQIELRGLRKLAHRRLDHLLDDLPA